MDLFKTPGNSCRKCGRCIRKVDTENFSRALVHIPPTASSPTSNYYIGAVVEYHPVTKGDNGTAIANENAKNYLTFLKTASENEVDIIVFPENALFSGKTYPLNERSNYLPHSTYLPHPKDSKVPCHDTSSNVMEAVKAMSCAAKRHAMYIVINVREKEKCTGENCSKDGHNLYNTNLVFDRTGAIVAKYRKWNLFGEAGMNRTSKPDISTFRTDFDVNFGQFICFDLLFGTPAIKLVREKKVTDIIFSSHWFSELPFLTANQIQTGWSYAHNVNFLGSGYNNPATGSGGSGIYGGKDGHFARIWSEKSANALIVAKIPKIVNGQHSQPINPNDAMVFFYSITEIPTINQQEPVPQQKIKMDDLSPYTTELFQPANGTHNLTLCNNDLCCNFTTNTVHRDDMVQGAAKYYRYRFAVFNGVRSFSNIGTGGVEVCSVISCLDENPTSCNQRFDTNTIIVHPTTFNSIVISSVTKDSSNVTRLPLSINTELHPLNVTDFTFVSNKINATHVSLKYTLTKPRKDLMTFAIYGRNFTADGLPKTTSASAQIIPPIYLMSILFIILAMGNTYQHS
ncbi:Similar to vanin-like: Vanin-like protein 1 (Drosophila melanogaster) [Cotesia congregata]|uniref:Similar to vanin-like: Vanin-like protein 1 (Drosophila melanogaster) n=1 Tax=Cotesia congregata TaxID=51543 RepID=A0A8J2HLP9_COTCN|nr:Similar to vanin-like: Vanin-like protein 1 (Drosophila melanogaster) [Cotesia congregata]